MLHHLLSELKLGWSIYEMPATRFHTRLKSLSWSSFAESSGSSLIFIVCRYSQRSLKNDVLKTRQKLIVTLKAILQTPEPEDSKTELLESDSSILETKSHEFQAAIKQAEENVAGRLRCTSLVATIYSWFYWTSCSCWRCMVTPTSVWDHIATSWHPIWMFISMLTHAGLSLNYSVHSKCLGEISKVDWSCA